MVEEADESMLWLEMLSDAGIIAKEKLADLANEARQLTAIFTASQQTAKRK